jgi:MFS family permease
VSEVADRTMTRPKKSRFFYGYVLAGYSFTISFLVSSFFLHSRGIFFPLWMDDFDVGRTEIALVISLTLFTGSCLAPFLGYLIDRLPLKAITTVGALWLAIGYILLRSVESYTGFFVVLVCFQGVAWGTMGPLMQTKIMVNWFTRNRGLALGVAIMGFSVAGIVMPTVATFLASELGWRDTYGLYSIIIILVIIPLTVWLVKQDPSVVGQYPDGANEPFAPHQTVQQQAANQSSGFVATYKEFLTSKAFWSVVITFGLMNGVYSAMITHLPNYLIRELDFDLYDASFVLGVAGAAAIFGKIAFGWLMDHFDAKRTVLLAVTAYFSSTIVFIFFQNYSLIMIAAGLFGLGFGGMVPVRSVLLSRLFGTEKFSRVNGMLAFFLAPATFWVLITGYIADEFGTYTVAFEVWAVSFLLAGIVSFLVKLPNPDEAVS